MAAVVLGLYDWNVRRDREGHRDYEAVWKVYTDDPNWGPAHVLLTPGLPAIGSSWFIGNDFDDWAFCMPDWQADEFGTRGEPNQHWLVRQPFSTRPLSRCQDASVENPLLEPAKLSGGNTIFTREATEDRLGVPLVMPSHERIRGPMVEVDDGLPTVRISINTLAHPVTFAHPLRGLVNESGMWGLDARQVKFKNYTWERNLYGLCTAYYTTTMEFQINEEGFTRRIPAEGRRCLAGHSPGTARLKPGPTHPANGGGNAADFVANPLDPLAIDTATGLPLYKVPRYFEVYKDVNGENATALLTQYGVPATSAENAYTIEAELEDEGNLLLLGIPATL